MSLLDLDKIKDALGAADPVRLQGRVIRASGLIVEAAMPGVALGTACDILLDGSGRRIGAEVVGFSGGTALLVPLGEMQGICEGCPVIAKAGGAEIAFGESLLGRVIDATGKPIDGGPGLILRDKAPLSAPPPASMTRRRITTPLTLGVRAIDSCLTFGEGQRVGVMAGPGVGKSVLLGMIAKHAKAEIIVVGLIGERGREVREFVERDLGKQGLARSVVIVATADESPLLRVRAAMAATAVAEGFRRKGKKVMLLMDSLSRVAMAQREIGLAAGEPPTSKGYPPSVFAAMPRLLERAGTDEGKGSITALYTLLAEGDDLSDPVVDAARAALDGHIILSRKMAGSGHFPAIDLLGSVSRVMTDIVDQGHRDLANSAREVLSLYRESADLIEVGAYTAGTNPKLDKALMCLDGLNTFLKQKPEDHSAMNESLAQLKRALTPAPAPRAPIRQEFNRG